MSPAIGCYCNVRPIYIHTSLNVVTPQALKDNIFDHNVAGLLEATVTGKLTVFSRI